MTEFTPKPGPLPRRDENGVWDDFYVVQLEDLRRACCEIPVFSRDCVDSTGMEKRFLAIHDCMVVLGIFDHEGEA